MHFEKELEFLWFPAGSSVEDVLFCTAVSILIAVVVAVVLRLV